LGFKKINQNARTHRRDWTVVQNGGRNNSVNLFTTATGEDENEKPINTTYMPSLNANEKVAGGVPTTTKREVAPATRRAAPLQRFVTGMFAYYAVFRCFLLPPASKDTSCTPWFIINGS
ncbi:unnamed protein product, partial [Ectocarpus sp. 12 AP-2014]